MKIDRHAASPARSAPPASRWAVARFLVRFVVLLVVMEAVYHALVLPAPPSNAYNRANTAAAAAALQAAGRSVHRHGVLLSADGGQPIRVQWGCDGLEPMGVLVAGLLAFPCAWGRRLAGAAAGIGILGVLNVARLATLALASAHAPALFDVLHLEIWPAVLVLAAVVLWIACVAWPVRPRPAAASAGGRHATA